MADLGNFDATQHDPNGTFEPIPAGEYTCMIIDSEMRPTQKGNGEFLQLTLEILTGEHKSRRLFDRLNLRNPSDSAVKIASSTLSQICHSVGVLKPKDSAELHGKPMTVKVTLSERNDKPGEFRNEVKHYSAANGTTPQSPTSAKADNSTPPWKQKKT